MKIFLILNNSTFENSPIKMLTRIYSYLSLMSMESEIKSAKYNSLQIIHEIKYY